MTMLKDLLDYSYVDSQLKREEGLTLPQPTRCLHTGFFEYAKDNPKSVALHDTINDRDVTYGELSQMAFKVANLLLTSGVTIGDKVAITLPRGVEQLYAIFGILAIGACYVPVSVSQPLNRRRSVHSTMGIKYAVTSLDTMQTVEFPVGVKVLPIEDALNDSTVNHITVWDGSKYAPAYVILTSGSTGEPKGVEISHYGAWNTISDVNNRCKLNSSDVLMGVSAIDFDLSVYDIFGALSVGASIVVLAENTRRDASFLLKQMLKYNVTVWNSVPMLLDMLLTYCEVEKVSSLPLSVVMLSGDWIGLDLPTKLENLAKGCKFMAMGGATEASIWSNLQDVTLPLNPDWKSIPYGYPLSHQIYRVVDDDGNICPNNVIGELWIGGAGVAIGYCGDVEKTATKFTTDNGIRWYHTGDLGLIQDDGTIIFIGRKDYQVKVNGHRIELEEVEHATLQCPKVKDAVCVVKSNTICVYYTTKDDTTIITENELLDVIREYVPEYMCPKYYIKLDELPITNNGKVDRKYLISMELEVKQDDTPLTNTQKQLTKIYAEILGHEVALSDSFFHSGGDSLLAIRLIQELNDTFDLDFSLTDILEFLTVLDLNIFDMAKFIDDKIGNAKTFQNNDSMGIVHRTETTKLPLSPLQEGMWVTEYSAKLSGVYFANVVASSLISIDGFDLVRFTKAINTVINYESVFKVTFKEVDYVPYMEYSNEVKPITIELEDYSNKPWKEVCDILKLSEVNKPFDLGNSPLIRFRLAKVAGGELVFVVCSHHILCDAMSINFILREIHDVYEGTPLNEKTITYTDYCYDMVEKYRNNAFSEDVLYWKDKFNNLPSGGLGKDITHSGISRYEASCVEVTLPTDVTKSLMDICSKLNVTMYVMMVVILSKLVQDCTHESKIAFGTGVIGRQALEVQNMVGDFANVELLHLDFSTIKDLASALRLANTQVSEMLRYSNLPYEKLMQETHIDRKYFSLPYRLLLNYIDTTPSSQGGMFSNVEFGCNSVASAEMVLLVHKFKGDLSIKFLYQTEVYSQEEVKSLAERFSKVAESFANEIYL